MRRYLVFKGGGYPLEGMHDFLTSCDSVLECKEEIQGNIYTTRGMVCDKNKYTHDEWEDCWGEEWAHIYDSFANRYVWSSGIN